MVKHETETHETESKKVSNEPKTIFYAQYDRHTVRCYKRTERIQIPPSQAGI